MYFVVSHVIKSNIKLILNPFILGIIPYIEIGQELRIGRF